MNKILVCYTIQFGIATFYNIEQFSKNAQTLMKSFLKLILEVLGISSLQELKPTFLLDDWYFVIVKLNILGSEICTQTI